MRSYFILPLIALLFSTIANAQLDKLSKENISGAANAGKLVTQFANALKPTSFTDAWSGEKAGWIGKAQKVSQAASLANSISSLAGFIKPGMFKQGFNVQTILQTANTVKSMTDAAGLLKTLEGGLKPEAFVNGWTQKRGGWLSALNLLKG